MVTCIIGGACKIASKQCLSAVMDVLLLHKYRRAPFGSGRLFRSVQQSVQLIFDHVTGSSLRLVICDYRVAPRVPCNSPAPFRCELSVARQLGRLKSQIVQSSPRTT